MSREERQTGKQDTGFGAKGAAGGPKPQMSNVGVYFLHAVTPLHAGVGEGVGAINLPTARERATEYPFMPGSSVKGVLRERAEQIKGGESNEAVVVAFGPPSEFAADARGGLVFTDASLLCLPVRSLFGTFAWVTCPLALRRFVRDATEAGLEAPALPLLTKDAALAAGTCLVSAKATTGLFLEEVRLDAAADSAGANAWVEWLKTRLFAGDEVEQGFFSERFVIVRDDIFSYYTKMCLEVRNRVKIDDDRGTAAKSGPWTEEHVPTESLFTGLAIARQTAYVKRGWDEKGVSTEEKPSARKMEDSWLVLNELLRDRPVLRFGGHASVGLGRARIGLI